MGCVERPKTQNGSEYNYAYYPVIFKNENELLRVFDALHTADIFPRRYFYPSLNKLPYASGESCPISEDISSRIACLPLYAGLEDKTIQTIAKTVKKICAK